MPVHTKEHESETDLTALLFEAEDALRAIRHGSAGTQPGVDPAAGMSHSLLI